MIQNKQNHIRLILPLSASSMHSLCDLCASYERLIGIVSGAISFQPSPWLTEASFWHTSGVASGPRCAPEVSVSTERPVALAMSGEIAHALD